MKRKLTKDLEWKAPPYAASPKEPKEPSPIQQICASRGIREYIPLETLLTELGWRPHLEGNWSAPDHTVLSPLEISTWLENKGWKLSPQEKTKTKTKTKTKQIRYFRAKIKDGKITHFSKNGKVRIIKDSDGNVPCYTVDILQPPAWNRIIPPRHIIPRTVDQYKGWWRLRDAKEAAKALLNDGDLPETGKKPSPLPDYGTYDPAKEGYGTPDQWKATMNVRIGRTEAEKVLNGQDPLVVLANYAGSRYLKGPATKASIKKLYRTCAAKHHPDKGGDAATFRKIQAAYELLLDPTCCASP